MKRPEGCLGKNMEGLEENTQVPEKTWISARLLPGMEAEPRVT